VRSEHRDRIRLATRPIIRVFVVVLTVFGLISFFWLGQGTIENFFQGLGFQLIGAGIIYGTLELWVKGAIISIERRERARVEEEGIESFSFSEAPLWMRQLEVRREARHARRR
jgi:hypothetical protein